MYERLKKTHSELLVPVESFPDTILEKVHQKNYLTSLQRERVEGETPITEKTWPTARVAADAALTAAKALKEADTAFSFCRPPGHHAGPNGATIGNGTPWGFCYLNNLAIAVRYWVEKFGGPVLVVDWDLHRGDGTQEIFRKDPDVFVASIQLAGQFPGDVGLGAKRLEESVRNVYLPTLEREAYWQAFQKLIEETLSWEKFELVAVSCGFDTHKDDPFASGYGGLIESDYAKMLELVSRTAPKTLVCLEGGYNPQAIRETSLALIG